MKGFLFLGMIVGLLGSCKAKAPSDDTVYHDIMKQSIPLHAVQQKGQNNPGKFVTFSDTLYTNDKLPKEVVDSINTARKLEYRRAGY
ncbi:MAG TPA: hypothetical protein VLY87_00805 [Flavobacterium sp.]|nr:hypothetical protein [Flavobacterium sp.]